MLDGVPIGSLTDGIGTVGVILLVGFLVVTGRLVPRRTYEDQVHEANEWRAESRIKDQQIAEKDTQLRHMGEVGRTVEQIMGAISARANDRDAR